MVCRRRQKNIETAHAAELAALAAKHAAEIERWQDQTSNLLSEKAAAERKVTVVEKDATRRGLRSVG